MPVWKGVYLKRKKIAPKGANTILKKICLPWKCIDSPLDYSLLLHLNNTETILVTLKIEYHLSKC